MRSAYSYINRVDSGAVKARSEGELCGVVFCGPGGGGVWKYSQVRVQPPKLIGEVNYGCR